MRNTYSTRWIIGLCIVMAFAVSTGLSQERAIEFTPADEAVLREMVRKYYTALVTGDFDTEFSIWSMY